MTRERIARLTEEIRQDLQLKLESQWDISQAEALTASRSLEHKVYDTLIATCNYGITLAD